MTEIRKDGYVFSVDIEKTKDYYKTNTVCECEGCQYLHSNISGRFPELEAFLADFGVDITNFDETSPVELDGEYLYTFIGYTVCGKILNSSEHDIVLHNTDGIRVGVDRGFAFPSNQKGECFSLSVLDVSLPCEKIKARSLLSRIKRIFGDRN